jgi:hypothetical protein
MGETERTRAPSNGWVHLEAPGQSAHAYVKEGDEVTVTFEPDDEEGDP